MEGLSGFEPRKSDSSICVHKHYTWMHLFISSCIWAPCIEYHHTGFISSDGEGSSVTEHNNLRPVIRDCAQGTVLEGSETVADLLIDMSNLQWRQKHRIRRQCSPRTLPFLARIPSSKGEAAPPSGESKYSALRSFCLQNLLFPLTNLSKAQRFESAYGIIVRTA